MKTANTIESLRKLRWQHPDESWGLVPTMGFLHEGHLDLVRRARAENDRVGVSIFVNPIQFNNAADLEKYPRNLQRDLDMLAAEGVDLVWTPAPENVYPPDFQTFVSVEKVTLPLEGASRPGHFRGVATVVAVLFNVFQPQRAYFGQKDAQQVVVIRQMVRDLAFNLQLVICPTVREADGLAMSSRNARLSPAARKDAAVLFRSLKLAEKMIAGGERNADVLKSEMAAMIQKVPGTSIDYISVAHPDSLAEMPEISGSALVSLAVFIDDIRLIDNILINQKLEGNT